MTSMSVCQYVNMSVFQCVSMYVYVYIMVYIYIYIICHHVCKVQTRFQSMREDNLAEEVTQWNATSPKLQQFCATSTHSVLQQRIGRHYPTLR